METLTIQITFIIGLIIFLGIIIYFLRKQALSLKYSLLWLLSVLIMLIISIFPKTIIFISEKLGFQVVSNAIFALIIGFILMILLSITSIVSKQTGKIKTLAQEIALLEKKIRELEKKEYKYDT